MEEWKDIPGYEGIYKISSYGRVKTNDKYILCGHKRGGLNLIKGRFISLDKLISGYIRVSLYHNGKRERILVHRLVAQAFIHNPQNKSQVNHLDGNKSNNHFMNLDWATPKENVSHAFQTGLRKINKGEQVGGSKLKPEDVLNIRKLFNSNTNSEIGKLFGVSRDCIYNIKREKTWTHI